MNAKLSKSQRNVVYHPDGRRRATHIARCRFDVNTDNDRLIELIPTSKLTSYEKRGVKKELQYLRQTGVISKQEFNDGLIELK